MNIKKSKNKKEEKGVLLQVPLEFHEAIEQHQKAFADRYNVRQPNKKDIMIKMLRSAVPELNAETKRMETEFANYNKSK